MTAPLRANTDPAWGQTPDDCGPAPHDGWTIAAEAHSSSPLAPLASGASERPKLLIAGAGPAGLEALIAVRHLAEERVDIELLAPERHFIYRPLTVGEPFGLGQARRYELSQIVADHGATLVRDTLREVDAERHEVGTGSGAAVAYDALMIALGGKAGRVLPGAIALRGPGHTSQFGRLLRQLEAGTVQRVAFAAPSGVVWKLPLYELALMTAAHLAEHDRSGAELALVTPEARPLELFGVEASEAVARLLEQRGVELHTGRHPTAFAGGMLTVVPADHSPLELDRVVSLPELAGPHIPGLPQTGDGFIPVDAHGAVEGAEDVYAAGDATGFPVKQGGLATQQADAVAEMVAARAGAPIEPQPFRPVLRGLLLTGTAPRYMRAEIAGGHGEGGVSEQALWWPPSKIAGRYLSPYLGARHQELAPDPDAVPVEVELREGLEGEPP